MKKSILGLLLITAVSFPVYAADYGDTSDDYATFVTNDSINIYSGSGTITEMTGGSISEMTDDTQIIKMNIGDAPSSIGTMSGNASILLSEGNSFDIGTIQDSAHLGEIYGVTINEVTGNATIDYLDSSFIGTVSGGATINEISYGSTITSLEGNARIENAYDVTIDQMKDKADIRQIEVSNINNMNGGFIGSAYDVNIGSMNNAYIGGIGGGSSFIDYVSNSTIDYLVGNTQIDVLEGSTINWMGDATHINSIEGYYDGSNVIDSYLGTVAGNAAIDYIGGAFIGTVSEFATIGDIVGGTINSLEGDAHILNVHDYVIIEEMKENAIIESFGVDNYSGHSSTINNMNGGTILSMGEFANIGTMRDGRIDVMEGGSIGEIRGTEGGSPYVDTITGSAHINTVQGAAIGTVSGDARIEGFTDGSSVLSLGGNASVVWVFDSTIEEMKENAYISEVYSGRIVNMSGGTIEYMLDTSSIEYMENGHITSLGGEARIANAVHSVIDNVGDSAKIDYAFNTNMNIVGGGAIISSMESGSIGALTDFARIDEAHSVSIGAMDGDAVIENLLDGSTLNEMYNGTVNNLSEGSTINNMTGGTVKNMNDSATITTMSAGSVGNIASTANIDLISGGTIYGNVASGTAFTVENGGSVELYAEDTTKTFDRIINAGVNSVVKVKDYQFGSDSEVNIGDNGSLFINSVDLNKASFADGSSVHFDNSSGFVDASIAEFYSTGQVTFNFSLDEEMGGSNDYLTIANVASGSSLNHIVGVSGRNLGSGHRSPIRLLEDQNGSLNLSLLTGEVVGIGAQNYSLSKEGGIWSLILESAFGPSDQARVIGAIVDTRLMTIYSISDSLTKRLGDIRNFNFSSDRLGSWIKTYTDQGGFKDLASVRIQNYGIEAGVDKELLSIPCGRMISGVAVGVNYGKQDIKTNNSRDGGGDSTTPYVGIYNTFLWDSGLYIDTIARYAYLDQNAYYYDGENMKNKFESSTHVAMLSTEVGYKYQVTNKFAVEPRAELMYAFLKGSSFRDDAHYKAKYDDAHSILGSMGMLFRYEMEAAEPYFKVGYLHEFDGKTSITYDDTGYATELDGGRFEVGVGFVAKTESPFEFFGETTYQTGHNSYRNYNVNLGMRYNF